MRLIIAILLAVIVVAVWCGPGRYTTVNHNGQLFVFDTVRGKITKPLVLTEGNSPPTAPVEKKKK